MVMSLGPHKILSQCLHCIKSRESVESFAQHMHDLYKTIRDQLNATNIKYKTLADNYKRDKNYKIGDYCWVCRLQAMFLSCAWLSQWS